MGELLYLQLYEFSIYLIYLQQPYDYVSPFITLAPPPPPFPSRPVRQWLMLCAVRRDGLSRPGAAPFPLSCGCRRTGPEWLYKDRCATAARRAPSEIRSPSALPGVLSPLSPLPPLSVGATLSVGDVLRRVPGAAAARGRGAVWARHDPPHIAIGPRPSRVVTDRSAGPERRLTAPGFGQFRRGFIVFNGRRGGSGQPR